MNARNKATDPVTFQRAKKGVLRATEGFETAGLLYALGSENRTSEHPRGSNEI